MTHCGGLNLEDVKIGDIHYEYGYGTNIKSEVLTLPKRNRDGLWSWKSMNIDTGVIIDYAFNENYPQYALNIYKYESYDRI